MSAATPSHSWEKHVLPHGQLEQLAPRLWSVAGSLPHGAMPRNMIVHKLRGGGLLVHSVIALDEATMAKLLRLGEPTVMIVPNGMHRLDAAVWKERFPNMQVLAPEAARAKVAKKIKVEATCEDELPSHGVAFLKADGIRAGELIYECEIDDGRKALVVTDILMNLPNQAGGMGWLFKQLGSTGFFGMTAIGRLLLLDDRKKFKDWLLRMATRPDLAMVCVGHGQHVVQDVREHLRAAAERL